MQETTLYTQMKRTTLQVREKNYTPLVLLTYKSATYIIAYPLFTVVFQVSTRVHISIFERHYKLNLPGHNFVVTIRKR